MPIGKEFLKDPVMDKAWNKEGLKQGEGRPGTAKRKQYYRKRVGQQYLPQKISVARSPQVLDSACGSVHGIGVVQRMIILREDLV